MSEHPKHVYFVILATDVIGEDPGNGKMAWVKFNGALDVVDVNNLNRYFPVRWGKTFQDATIMNNEVYARQLWACVKKDVEQMTLSEMAHKWHFGFVPATLALVRYEGNGSWQMTTVLVDSYWFEDAT